MPDSLTRTTEVARPVRPPQAWATLAVSLALVATPGCGDTRGPGGDANHDSPSNWPASAEGLDGEFPACAGHPPAWPPTVDHVVVSGEEAPCELDFVEVVTLRPDDDAWHPRPPIAVTPDGGFVTGTWHHGTLALWTPDGALVRTFGQGPGDGPGEFSWASAILVDRDSMIHVTSGPLVHRYTIEGRFLETFRLPVPSGVREASITAEGHLLLSALAVDASLRRGVVLWTPGGARVYEEPGGHIGDWFLHTYSRPLGLWVAGTSSYEVVHVAGPDEEPVFRMVRSVDWFPGEGRANPPNLYLLEADPAGLIYTLASAPAPDAPPGPLPSARSVEEIRAHVNLYRENVIEALSVDGRLIASRRYRLPSETPTPITPDRWYLELPDLEQTIVILEPVLRRR